jgi:predicted enzyme related to lactoylglutathione lyase
MREITSTKVPSMAAFKVLATNHTSFTVSDLDRTIAFFRDAMGFEVTSKAPRDPAVVSKIIGIEFIEKPSP